MFLGRTSIPFEENMLLKNQIRIYGEVHNIMRMGILEDNEQFYNKKWTCFFSSGGT
jgi:hypothetical protein